jgi:ribosomal protein L9
MKQEVETIYNTLEDNVSEVTHYEAHDGQLFESVTAAHIYQAFLMSEGDKLLFAGVLKRIASDWRWS